MNEAGIRCVGHVETGRGDATKRTALALGGILGGNDRCDDRRARSTASMHQDLTRSAREDGSGFFDVLA